MRGLTRDETVESVSRNQILSCERVQGKNRFPCSADPEQGDWQPCPVDLYSTESADHTYVHYVVDATRLGAWLRSGEGIGWLATGIIPNSLYRVPFLYFFSGRCILLLLLSFCRLCFVSLCFLLLSLELCRCSSDRFLSSRPRTGFATTYITYWVWLRPDRLM